MSRDRVGEGQRPPTRKLRRILRRLRHLPPDFLLHQPLPALRNLVGNHPSPLADRYLRGLRGVELGGTAHNTFFLDTVNVDYVAVPDTSDAQRRHAGRVMAVDVLAPAHALPFADDSYDFVLASHTLEHIPDPVRALLEWVRVARRYVFLLLPQRENHWDRLRLLTSVEELLDRYACGFDSRENRHWSVWTSASFVALCQRLGLRVVEVQDPDDKRGNGFAVVIDATGAPPRPPVTPGAGTDGRTFGESWRPGGPPP